MNFGVVGCGGIGHRFIAGLNNSKTGVLKAVCSQNPQRAQAYAEKYHVTAYTDYEMIFADEDIEVVYIATYNANHFELIIEALKHKKHVLCEKPMVLSEVELNECFALAYQQGCFLMEAQKAVFLPVLSQVKKWLPKLGKPLYAHLSYMSNGHYPQDNWVLNPEIGGSMRSVGVYPLSVVYALFGNRYLQVTQNFTRDQSGCDVIGHCTFVDESLVIDAVGSLMIEGFKGMQIHGPNGSIECPQFWKAQQVKWTHEGKQEVVDFPHTSEFIYYIDHAIECIEQGLIESPIMSKAASQFCLKYMQAC